MNGINCSRASIHVLIVNDNIECTKSVVSDLMKQDTIFDLTIYSKTNDDFSQIKNRWKQWVGRLNIIISDDSLSEIYNHFASSITNMYICFLNCETRIMKTFVSDSVKILNRENTVGVVTYNHVNNLPNPQKILKYSKNFDYINDETFTLRRRLYKPLSEKQNSKDIFSYLYNEKGYECAKCESSPIIAVERIKENITEIVQENIQENNVKSFQENIQENIQENKTIDAKKFIVDKIVNAELKCSDAPLHIFIPNFNQIQMTDDIVSDLLLNEHNFDLTIFDQGSIENSTDKTYERIKKKWKIDNRCLNIVKNGCNAPLNHVWNWFADNVKNRYICLLNNDTRVLDNFTAHIVKILNDNKNCGIVTHATNNIKYTSKLQDTQYETMTNERQGWAFTIRKELYKPIDNRLILMSGDNCIYANIYKQGYKAFICTSSPVLHYCSTTCFMTAEIRKKISEISKLDDTIYRTLGFDNILKRTIHKLTTGGKPTAEFIKAFVKRNTFRKICYTAITGDYDKLKEPTVVTNGWRYICFTDSKIESNTWEIVNIPSELMELSNVKKQRMLKICPNRYLPNYDECIWIDGNITVQCNLNDFVEDNCKGNFCTVTHPMRNCIYDECDVVKKGNIDTSEHTEAIKKKLKLRGFPANNGLAETNLIYRKNTNDVNRLCDEWGFQMLVNGTHRDQLMFNFVEWKLKGKVYYLPKDIVRNGKLFKLNRHAKNSSTKGAAIPQRKISFYK